MSQAFNNQKSKPLRITAFGDLDDDDNFQPTILITTKLNHDVNVDNHDDGKDDID